MNIFDGAYGIVACVTSQHFSQVALPCGGNQPKRVCDRLKSKSGKKATPVGCKIMQNQDAGKRIIPPEILLQGYSTGIFPMSESRDDDTVNWYSAVKRGIIPMEDFHVSKNVQRIIRQGRFECRINTCFSEVIRECASRKTTWISELIINSFEVLHQAGHAHSVEMFNKTGKLAGGLYGVSLGGAFFGESMFKKEKEADKVALWHCHQILQKNGFVLWDTQFYTDHLSQFGCIEISPEEYEKRLTTALQIDTEFNI